MIIYVNNKKYIVREITKKNLSTRHLNKKVILDTGGSGYITGHIISMQTGSTSLYREFRVSGVRLLPDSEERVHGWCCYLRRDGVFGGNMSSGKAYFIVEGNNRKWSPGV